MPSYTNPINANTEGVVYISTGGLPAGLDGSTAGFVLTSNGTGVAPSFQAASAGGAVLTFTGNSGGVQVPTAGGNFNLLGTGSITTVGSLNTETFQLTGLTNHAVLVGAGTATITKIAATANTGAVLQNNSGADPSYSTATYPSTTTINQILYSSAANTVTGLATGNNGILITSSSGVPSLLANGTTGQILTATTGSPPSWQNAGTASITLTGDSGGPLTSSSFTLTGGTTGLTLAGVTTTFTLGGTLVVGNGGTGATTFTSHGVLLGNTTSAVTATAAGTTGQVLTGVTGSAPTFQALPFTKMPWTDEAVSFAAASNNGYFVTANATGTLPASPAQGDVIAFAVDSASGILTIQANTGQTIQVGKSISASAGVCVSNFNGDSIELVFRSSDNNWISVGAPEGTWSIT